MTPDQKAILALTGDNERLRASKKHWQDVAEKHSNRADEAEDKNDLLRACLDTIERRLEEGYAPEMPWSNEEMALGIVREERQKGEEEK